MIETFRNAWFESERLRMRPQTPDDAAALHEGYRDVELMTYWSSAPHSSLAETVDYLTWRPEDLPWRGWLVIRKEDGAVIGTVATHDRREQVAEIGYLLLRRFWNQGYAREAVSRLVTLLLEDEGYRRIYADTDPDNSGSNRLLRRLGFTLEGRLRGEWETHIGIRDSLIWGLLKEDWHPVG